MVAILEREPAPLDQVDPRIPHELQRIVGKALRKDRQQRYQTITDLRLDLEALRADVQSSMSASRRNCAGDATACSAISPPRVERGVHLDRAAAAQAGTAASALAAVAVLGGGAWWARPGSLGDRPRRRGPAHKPDKADIRRRTPDGPDVVARWPVPRLRLRSRREFRHLGPAGGRRRPRASDEVSRTRHAARVVARREHDRLSIRASGGLYLVPALGGSGGKSPRSASVRHGPAMELKSFSSGGDDDNSGRGRLTSTPCPPEEDRRRNCGPRTVPRLVEMDCRTS